MNKAKTIQRALRERGTSLYAWARDHGFEQRSVYQAVHFWGDRTDREPRGNIYRKIIRQLREELGTELLPEPESRKEAA